MRGDPLPIRRIAGNVVFSREGDAWACFSVRCRSYRAEPQKRRAALVEGLAEYTRKVQADFQILRVSRRFESSEYAQRLRDGIPEEAHGPLWLDYIDQHERLLEGLEAWTPEAFICVRLADPTMDLASKASRLFDHTPSEWRQLARQKVSGPRTTKSQEVADRARIAQSRLHICLDARPATYAELVADTSLLL